MQTEAIDAIKSCSQDVDKIMYKKARLWSKKTNVVVVGGYPQNELFTAQMVADYVLASDDLNLITAIDLSNFIDKSVGAVRDMLLGTVTSFYLKYNKYILLTATITPAWNRSIASVAQRRNALPYHLGEGEIISKLTFKSLHEIRTQLVTNPDEKQAYEDCAKEMAEFRPRWE